MRKPLAAQIFSGCLREAVRAGLDILSRVMGTKCNLSICFNVTGFWLAQSLTLQRSPWTLPLATEICLLLCCLPGSHDMTFSSVLVFSWRNPSLSGKYWRLTAGTAIATICPGGKPQCIPPGEVHTAQAQQLKKESSPFLSHILYRFMQQLHSFPRFCLAVSPETHLVWYNG